ncbi:hypothetical protein OKW24_005700 [Peribacillus simplex]|uniref:hypothetical protein n=1 Tax=Peribacillus simplex TaxID=1478 RepID=UPI0024E1F240|nr:hypothetical protein [Peribacillus simplex]MDF9763804.1 hypothetical protein [Peribacillus simplex]
MADYKLYDTETYSVLIDPGTNEEIIYQEKQEARLYANQKPSYMIMKDSIPPEVKSSIEKSLGKIEFSYERVNERDYYATVKNHNKGCYDCLDIEKQDDGYKVKVKSGFPDSKQAFEHVKKQRIKDLQSLADKIDLSRL